MSNESEVEVTTTENSNEEVEVETETVVPEKPPIVETAEAKMARLTRQLRKVKQQLGIEEEEVESGKKVTTKQFVLDRSDKAYLVANGIKGQEEFDLVTEYVNNTGKDLEEVIETKFFNNDLKELRVTKESRSASDAASGNNRTGQSARDTVDYWIGKGKLPPPYMTQLRRDVVNARLKSAKEGSKFSENSVIQ